jgi:hypothetical protein
MSDLKWFGNTEYDTKSGFYFINPNQIHQWDVKEPWTGYHILISPLLLQSTILTLVFYNMKLMKLFLTEDEQIQIENLYIQDEYQKTITN